MSRRLVRVLLFAYPPSLRHDYGGAMADAVSLRWRDCRSLMSRLRLGVHLVGDVIASWRGPRTPPMRDVSSDLRDALRLFRRAPAFAFGAVITLSLGTGASTAILSLADATLLRPLPVTDADQILQSTLAFSYADFRDIEAEHRGFSSVAAFTNNPFAIERNGEVVQTVGNAVSGRYFALTGQAPVAGRLLDASDDVPGAPVTAVISERLWERAFRRDASILGATVNINRRPATIVGIVPASFRGLSLQTAPEVFVDVVNLPNLATGFMSAPGLMANRGRVWLNVVGRLAGGANPVRANDEARRIYYSHRAAKTEDTSVWFAPLLSQATGVRTSAALKRFLAILLGASAVTLLLTCSTVANLLLVRAERRSRELAVRMALGAGRARIARLLIVESLAIGVAGGLAGVLVARMTLGLLGSFALPGQILINDLRLTLNLQMLAASAGLGIITSFVFGLAPIWQTRRQGSGLALHAGSRTTSRHPMRSLLVAVQVALCVLLLGGSIAFGRAVEHALALDLGFNVTHTSITAVNPTLARYTSERGLELRTRALELLSGRPEVRGAAWALMRPLSGTFLVEPVVDGYQTPKGAPTAVQANVITGGYFNAMEIPLVAGRGFTSADDVPSAETIIITSSLAARYWPGGDAVGRAIRINDASPPGSKGSTVVGVASDIHRTVGGPPVPMIYVPAAQAPPGFSPDYLIVRSTGDPSALIPDIRAALRSIDPSVPITSSIPMTRHVEGPLMAHRLGLTLFTLFAALAAVLTTFGLYAVVASAVSQRTREIGIRVALGAESASVVRLVLRQGLLPIAAGLAAGVMAFVLSAKLIAGFMFSLPPVTPTTVGIMALAVAGIAVAALVAPARRALAVDPTTALRAE